jgi:uncharacterized protein YjlB
MTQPETHRFEDAGGFPNPRLPVLLYQDVGDADPAEACTELSARNGWLGAWTDGVFPFHHFHSTAHEVLGIVAGTATVILGGPDGRGFHVGRSDVLVLPAGTGHCNAGSSADLLVVGANPNGIGPARRPPTHLPDPHPPAEITPFSESATAHPALLPREPPGDTR